MFLSTGPTPARRLFAAGAALLLLSSCGGRRAGRVSTYPNAPVIVISVDTLRADHLPAYGYRGVETPNFDAFAADAIVYDNAFSHVPLTLPSHLTMLTGLLPQDHGVRDNIGYPFDAAKHPTIAGLLRKHGYQTGAAVSAYVLRRSTGIAADFDSYDDAIPLLPNVAVGNLQRPGTESVAVAQKWIDPRVSQPFFYFLHLFEPHSPYDPPQPYRARYANAYDGEIAWSDQILGSFIEWLKQKGIYDRAIIVVMSDHGEGLKDHGEEEHGILLYREEIHVPLMLKLPGSVMKGTRVATPAQLADIAPTIAALTGLDPLPGDRGVSLTALATQPPNLERKVFSETLYPRIHLGWSELRSLAGARYHLIDAPRPELYDMRADPAEKNDVLSAERRTFAAMRKELDSYGREMSVPQNIDPEEAKKLAALGYISAAKPTMEGNLPDPKDRIGDIEEVKVAFKLATDQRYVQAIAALRAVLERNPNWSDVWNRLGLTYEEMGDLDKAAETYRKAITVAPTLASEYALSLASVLERMGRFDEAEANAALALKANAPAAHQLLGRIALTRHQLDKAQKEAEAAGRFESHRYESAMLLARIQVARGDLPGALVMLDNIKRETEAKKLPQIENLEFLRGDALARMDRIPEAEQSFRSEIRAFPGNKQAYANLALIQVLQGRLEEGRRTMEMMAAANPSSSTYLFAARTLGTLGDKSGEAQWKRRAAAMPEAH